MRIAAPFLFLFLFLALLGASPDVCCAEPRASATDPSATDAPASHTSTSQSSPSQSQASQAPATDGHPALGIAVVANAAVPVRNLELHELKTLLLGERGYWNSRIAVKLVSLSESTPEAAAVRDRVCGMTASQLKRHWLELLFRGDGHAPKVAPGAEELCRLVAEQPGAIGCVTIEEALECAERHPDGVVLLSVDGVLPRHPGYPLH